MRLRALEGDEELDVDRVLLEDDDLAVALDLAVGASFRDERVRAADLDDLSRVYEAILTRLFADARS